MGGADKDSSFRRNKANQPCRSPVFFDVGIIQADWRAFFICSFYPDQTYRQFERNICLIDSGDRYCFCTSVHRRNDCLIHKENENKNQAKENKEEPLNNADCFHQYFHQYFHRMIRLPALFQVHSNIQAKVINARKISVPGDSISQRRYVINRVLSKVIGIFLITVL